MTIPLMQAIRRHRKSAALLLGAAMSLASFSVAAIRPMVDPVEREALWGFVEAFANSADAVGASVVDYWPGTEPLEPVRESGRIRIYDGGAFPIASSLRARTSEVRVHESGALNLALLEVEGSCVLPADVEKRFQDVERIAYPSPGDPNPHVYRRIRRGSLAVSFGFPVKGQGCLSRVVFDPDPVIPLSH
ncbi:hypothetical protein [Marilutibacter maris]|uniref:hypothetical protein n=1 Tax=Marilutibacter maris TaxID=1605891 RepID=UPI0011AEB292|nr:hypothetical protein [Lysobacter maris]